MTNQEQANVMLAHWQIQRQLGIIPEKRLPSDIGNLTYNLRDNTKDIADIWFKEPERRHEFGKKEVDDIAEVVLALMTIVIEMQRDGKI